MTLLQFFRFATVVFIFCVIFTLISCGGDSASSEVKGNKGQSSHQTTTMGIRFSAPQFLKAFMIKGLQCHAALDDGAPIALTVNPVDNTVSGTIKNIPPNTYMLKLTYFISIAGDDIMLCTHSSTITVNAGQTTTVTIPERELDRNHDSDYDGYTNLAEVRIGTNALDSASFPDCESPFVQFANGVADAAVSENYNASVVVGSPLAGTTASADFRVFVSHTGW